LTGKKFRGWAVRRRFDFFSSPRGRFVPRGSPKRAGPGPFQRQNKTVICPPNRGPAFPTSIKNTFQFFSGPIPRPTERGSVSVWLHGDCERSQETPGKSGFFSVLPRDFFRRPFRKTGGDRQKTKQNLCCVAARGETPIFQRVVGRGPLRAGEPHRWGATGRGPGVAHPNSPVFLFSRGWRFPETKTAGPSIAPFSCPGRGTGGERKKKSGGGKDGGLVRSGRGTPRSFWRSG